MHRAARLSHLSVSTNYWPFSSLHRDYVNEIAIEWIGERITQLFSTLSSIPRRVGTVWCITHLWAQARSVPPLADPCSQHGLRRLVGARAM